LINKQLQKMIPQQTTSLEDGNVTSSDNTTTPTTTTKPSSKTPSLPQRVSITRKAKDRCVEQLHEITAMQHHTPKSANKTANTTNTKRSSSNRSAYKHLPENNQNSDDDAEGTDTETPKKSTRTRRRNTSTILPKTSMLKVSNRNTTRGNIASANTATNTNLLITDETETESNSLYVQVLNSQASILTIVDDWIEVFSF
jgi:hypothetical protein